jgi:hemoglobin
MRTAAAVTMAVLIGACHPAPAPESAASVPSAAAPSATAGAAMPADTSLYGRLGGEAGIEAIASGLVARIAADGRVNPFFADTDLKSFEANLAKYLAQACGGPALYHGPDMKTVHADLGIADPQFDAVIEDVGTVLDQRQVSPADRAALLSRLERLRDDIVKH